MSLPWDEKLFSWVGKALPNEIAKGSGGGRGGGW